jgi:hypothetical protein
VRMAIPRFSNLRHSQHNYVQTSATLEPNGRLRHNQATRPDIKNQCLCGNYPQVTGYSGMADRMLSEQPTGCVGMRTKRIKQPPVPASCGTDRLSSRRKQGHPNHLAERFYASPGWYRHPSRETLRSEHSFPRRRAAGSHLPGGQCRGPRAGNARKPQARGGLLRKESRGGS